jgi:hypothetical protein
MSMQQTRHIMLGLFLTLIPAAAVAQDADGRTSILAAGVRSIELPFPTTESPARFGMWKMHSERTAIGLIGNVGLSRNTNTNGTGAKSILSVTDVALGPALKRYFQLHPTVAAFGTVGLQGIFHRVTEDATEDQTDTEWGGAANVGIGAEWFPFSRVSLGGTTGLSGGITTSSNSNTDADQSSLFLQTYTTSVQVQVYF